MSEDLSKLDVQHIPFRIRVKIAELTRQLAIAQAQNELLQRALNFYAAGNRAMGNKNKKAAENVIHLFPKEPVPRGTGPDVS